MNSKRKRLTRNILTKRLQHSFMKYTNKRISTSMIKNIYITDSLKRDTPILIKEKMMKYSMHSVNQQSQYTKIDDKDKRNDGTE